MRRNKKRESLEEQEFLEQKYQEKSQERRYLIKWRCEECGRGFQTVVKNSEVDEWSPQSLPEIPTCLKCGGDRVFYRDTTDIGTAAPKGDTPGKR